MADIYQNLSVRLYNILDEIGVSEDGRTKFKEHAISREIVATAYWKGNISMHTFGSRCEGTTTPGLKSDVDTLICDESKPVVEDVGHAPRKGRAYLMITDNKTKPGYVNLQVVTNGVPQSINQREIVPEREDIDRNGRILHKHELLDLRNFNERNGPAQTRRGRGKNLDIDAVHGLRCQSIPEKADFCLRKYRHWPAKSLLNKMQALGCFFVGVGHPHSKNKSIEWRISFSLQKRYLMSSLNSTQHKCYVLLKMIKKDIIHPKAGEKSISSYHCKTCLFHVICTSRPGYWSRGNLIQGVRVCLALLSSWVKTGNCPNYFIPEENMFDRLNQDTLDSVADILKGILKSGARFVSSIHCDDICTSLCLNDRRHQFEKKANQKKSSDFLCLLFAHDALDYRNKFLKTVGNTLGQRECLYKIISAFKHFEITKLGRDYTAEEVQMASQAVLPHIYLQLSQTVAAIVISNEEKDIASTLVRFFSEFLWKSEHCDLISSKLILATLFLRANKVEECNEILAYCDTLFKNCVISVCGCYNHTYRIETTETRLPQGWMKSIAGFRRKCTTGCLLFFRAHANLVHPPLLYEMFRSVYARAYPRDILNRDRWFESILVDSRVYLYFLQYILASKANKHMSKDAAINNIELLIHTDNLGHRETAYNILGWIYSQENRIQEAFSCFQKSWKIRPYHNAAKWHLALILFRISNSKLNNKCSGKPVRPESLPFAMDKRKV